MPLDYKVTCDSCNRDITDTDNCVAYRLKLSSEQLPYRSSVVTLLHVEPPIKETVYFCGLNCLKAWINK